MAASLKCAAQGSSVLVRSAAPVPASAVFSIRSRSTRTSHAVIRLADVAIRSRQVATFAKKGKGGGGSAAVEEGGKGGKGGKGDAKGGKGGDVDLAKVEKEAKADAEDRMKKTLASLADSFNTIRTGRANPAILDKIMVTIFDVPTPLKSLAQVSVPDASTLLILPYDKSTVRDIEKAIQESDIGINPSNDGERIRLNVPALTQERRKELAKSVSKFAEDGKVALRNVRKDAMKKIDKFDFSKDAKKDLEDAIQKMTDVNVKKVDEMAKTKTDEVMKL